jgi:hypothetical protein
VSALAVAKSSMPIRAAARVVLKYFTYIGYLS